MKLIIVNGKGKSGKDTFAIYFSEAAEKYGEKVIKYSTIDIVKKFAMCIGWNGGKEDKDRKFLSDLKIALSNWKDLPYQYIKEKIELESNFYDIILVDCREPEEIKRFVQDFQAITILIHRNELDNRAYGNPADDDVDNYKYDYIINNNGTLEDFQKITESFTKIICEGKE